MTSQMVFFHGMYILFHNNIQSFTLKSIFSISFTAQMQTEKMFPFVFIHIIQFKLHIIRIMNLYYKEIDFLVKYIKHIHIPKWILIILSAVCSIKVKRVQKNSINVVMFCSASDNDSLSVL